MYNVKTKISQIIYTEMSDLPSADKHGMQIVLISNNVLWLKKSLGFCLVIKIKPYHNDITLIKYLKYG